MFPSLVSLATLVSSAAATILYAGVNESGGEFAVYSSTATPGTGLPGRFGVDYAFINKSTVDIFVSKDKINLFRVAFLLERMVPVANGLGGKFNETYFAEFKDAIDYITVTKGAYAIFDAHNYMRYNDPSQQPATGSIIGNTADPKAATTAQFKAFWAELARRFVSNPKVIYGIMNEPHDMATSLILTNNQAAIDGIRAVGAKQLIIAPGNGYTGGHSWLQASQGDDPSGDYLYKLHDPINNTAIDIHEYLDVDFSGGHTNCTSPGPSNLAGVTGWLKQHGLKGILTEFGGSNTTQCYNDIGDLLDYLAANDVWIGWTAWAAGPLWGTYSACCTDSRQLGSLEPGTFAADGSPSLYSSVWATAIRPKIPKVLKRSGVSSLK